MPLPFRSAEERAVSLNMDQRQGCPRALTAVPTIQPVLRCLIPTAQHPVSAGPSADRVTGNTSSTTYGAVGSQPLLGDVDIHCPGSEFTLLRTSMCTRLRLFPLLLERWVPHQCWETWTELDSARSGVLVINRFPKHNLHNNAILVFLVP